MSLPRWTHTPLAPAPSFTDPRIPVRLVDEDRREVGAHVFDANGRACCVLLDDSRDGLDIDVVIRLDGFAP